MGGLVSALDELASEDVGSVALPVLGADLVELSRGMARLEAEFARRLAVFDRRGGADVEALPTAAWLRHRCRFSPGTAARWLKVARRVGELPATRAAFAAGEVSAEHVAVIAVHRDPAVAEAVAAVEASVVEFASRVTPKETKRLVDHVAHAALPEVLVARAEEQHERRWLHLSQTFDGMWALDAMLEPETGAELMTALNAVMAADRAPGDPRSKAQARADAFGVLVRGALDRADLPIVAGERPHLTVTVDLATLEQRAGAPAATLGWGGTVCGETARRLACDAKITRVITAGDSEVLDVGHTTRAVPPAIRKALEIRDRGCVWPGCDRPPPWTDAHHVVHWGDGGDTSLHNLVLLCRRHHRAVHEGRANVPIARAGPRPHRLAVGAVTPVRHGGWRVAAVGAGTTGVPD